MFVVAAKALEFDEASMKHIFTNLSALKEELPEAMQNALRHFVGVDRTIIGFEGLEIAQNAINTNEDLTALTHSLNFIHTFVASKIHIAKNLRLCI